MSFDLPYKELIRLMRNLAKEPALRIILFMNEDEFVNKEILLNTIVEQTLINKDKVKEIVKTLYYQGLIEFSGDGVSYPNDKPTFNRNSSIYVKISSRGKKVGTYLKQLIDSLE